MISASEHIFVQGQNIYPQKAADPWGGRGQAEDHDQAPGGASDPGQGPALPHQEELRPGGGQEELGPGAAPCAGQETRGQPDRLLAGGHLRQEGGQGIRRPGVTYLICIIGNANKQTNQNICQVNLNETWEEDDAGLFTGMKRLEVKTSHTMHDKVEFKTSLHVK